MKFKLQSRIQKHRCFPYTFLYFILLCLSVWQIATTLLLTAQMIRFRSLSVATTHKQTQLAAQIDQLKSQLVNKKAMSNLIASDQKPFDTPIIVYASITDSGRVANLLP